MKLIVTRTLVIAVVVFLMLAIICHLALVPVFVGRGNYTYITNDSSKTYVLMWNKQVANLTESSTLSNYESEEVQNKLLEETEKNLKEQIIHKGAVVTNGPGCSDIGKSILERGGNAVEAAIATLFCEGVSMPQSMGLGGGFLMTIYNRSNGQVEVLNAREKAPSFASKYMFEEQPQASQKGGLSVAVPGELMGYWAAYEKYGGNVPWSDLVQPTIDLCRRGIYVTDFLAKMFLSQAKQLAQDPELREVFIDKKTELPYVKGQYIHRRKLADALELIAKEGGLSLHQGSLLDSFITDIRTVGGIITKDDMEGYEPEWQEAVSIPLPNNLTLYSADLPGSGSVLAFILNMLISLGKGISNIEEAKTNHYLVETFKFAYAARTKLGDPKFESKVVEVHKDIITKQYAEGIAGDIKSSETFHTPEHYRAFTTGTEDHGTANIVVVAPNGDAVTVTSTINLVFGAGVAGRLTGIILNDEMDDFSFPAIINKFNLPPSSVNYIFPGKQPLSSMSPTIIVDSNGEVVMAVGAAGGTKITTAVAQAVLNHLWFGMDIEKSVDHRRLHHQLVPMWIECENAYNATDALPLLKGLREFGHKFKIMKPENGFAAVTAVSRDPSTGNVVGAFDKRRSGSVSYIK